MEPLPEWLGFQGRHGRLWERYVHRSDCLGIGCLGRVEKSSYVAIQRWNSAYAWKRKE